MLTTLCAQLYTNKTMQFTEKYTISVTENQKKTLVVLHSKYRVNTAKFIRDAINEKLLREKDSIFKKHYEVQKYLESISDCPF